MRSSRAVMAVAGRIHPVSPRTAIVLVALVECHGFRTCLWRNVSAAWRQPNASGSDRRKATAEQLRQWLAQLLSPRQIRGRWELGKHVADVWSEQLERVRETGFYGGVEWEPEDYWLDPFSRGVTEDEEYAAALEADRRLTIAYQLDGFVWRGGLCRSDALRLATAHGAGREFDSLGVS